MLFLLMEMKEKTKERPSVITLLGGITVIFVSIILIYLANFGISDALGAVDIASGLLLVIGLVGLISGVAFATGRRWGMWLSLLNIIALAVTLLLFT